uniref:Endonuclease/exonuclease/phosphatase domain-containing protein n=1 Tax=Photinus pyralis TaxID=7054 RepID=A0A1Y1L5T1_PHOPY
MILVNSFCRENRIHGGSLIYVKPIHNCISVPRITALSSEMHCEISCVYLPVLEAVVLCIYRSPQGDFKIFSSTMEKALRQCVKYRYVCVAGDFNINFLGADKGAVEVIDLMATISEYMQLCPSIMLQSE